VNDYNTLSRVATVLSKWMKLDNSSDIALFSTSTKSVIPHAIQSTLLQQLIRAELLHPLLSNAHSHSDSFLSQFHSSILEILFSAQTQKSQTQSEATTLSVSTEFLSGMAKELKGVLASSSVAVERQHVCVDRFVQIVQLSQHSAADKHSYLKELPATKLLQTVLSQTQR
jgi:hypothetical protein